MNNCVWYCVEVCCGLLGFVLVFEFVVDFVLLVRVLRVIRLFFYVFDMEV